MTSLLSSACWNANKCQSKEKDHTKNGHIKQCALYFEIESPSFIKKIDDNNTLS